MFERKKNKYGIKAGNVEIEEISNITGLFLLL